jgi:pimeloyl-ACP methyl ester carboxylesterase
MTVVLVHGNPETEAIWGPLVDALGRDDVVRLSPPGFGAPLPDCFPATYLAYRDWLEDALRGMDGPVTFKRHALVARHYVRLVDHDRVLGARQE